MKRFVLITFLTFTLISAKEKGLTNILLEENSYIGSKAKPYSSTTEKTMSSISPTSLSRENWQLVDSLFFDYYLKPGDHFGVQFDHNVNSIISVSNFFDLLTPEAETALQKTPKWLQPALRNKLGLLNPADQNELAAVINNSFDPYIDEIAYSIAHSSAEFLSSNFCYPQLFELNAIKIYSADNNLDYVEITDYGTSTTDENYYSTAKYWKINANGETIQFEIPKELYYLYVVHPKITDEIASYIDPDIIEDNTTHQNNITDPPDGKFWREFLFSQADTGYPILELELSGTNILWDDSGNANDTAIHKITGWINASMSFTSDYERPHQPVRIYRKHIGRCGEYADLTSAATRSALIPCTSVLSYSGDHTWNEFWNEEWIHWEPVNGYYNNPLVYENGWGKVFGSVFEIRSDGLLSPITERYSEGIATITLYSKDADGNPIDGAFFILKTGTPGLVYDNFGFTDEEGKYIFKVGEGRSYYARMQSAIGDDPVTVSEYSLLTDNALDGEEYEFVFTADGTMPELDFSGINTPEDTEDDFKIIFEFAAQKQIIHGNFIFDDIDETQFYADQDGGSTNFFMTDELSYLVYDVGGSFESFNEMLQILDGSVEFEIPTSENWFGFWDNSLALNNPVYLQGSAKLFEYIETEAGNEFQSQSPIVLSNFPNPFNPMTTISLEINDAVEKAELTIYNIKGQKIRRFQLSGLKAKKHKIIWDGKDEKGKSVSSGVYFYRYQTNDLSRSNKMILLK